MAQLAAFKDPISPRTDPSMAIHYNGSALWLDAQKNGNPWLNPYSTAAVEYVGDLVEEVQQLGFEQVVLTNVQFPKLSKKQDYGTTNGVSRADQLKADIAALQDRLSGKVTLWFSYTLDQCKNSSVALDVPALTLGVQNLLVTSDAAMDADALVMAAAVADYRPVTVASDKIKKKDGDLSIPVERTADILGTIGPKKTHQFLCGFSMETRDMVENSTAKLTRKNLDMVVANNLKVAGAGFGVDTNVVTFITPDGTRELPLMSKADVADAILDEILKRRGL